jgi:hypothetical protein
MNQAVISNMNDEYKKILIEVNQLSYEEVAIRLMKTLAKTKCTLFKGLTPTSASGRFPLSTRVERGEHRQVQGVSPHKTQTEIRHYFMLIT